MNMKALWDIAQSGLAEVYRRFRGTHCLQRPDDEGSIHL
jgi:hypothetical protein